MKKNNTLSLVLFSVFTCPRAVGGGIKLLEHFRSCVMESVEESAKTAEFHIKINAYFDNFKETVLAYRKGSASDIRYDPAFVTLIQELIKDNEETAHWFTIQEIVFNQPNPSHVFIAQSEEEPEQAFTDATKFTEFCSKQFELFKNNLYRAGKTDISHINGFDLRFSQWRIPLKQTILNPKNNPQTKQSPSSKKHFCSAAANHKNEDASQENMKCK